MKALWFSAILMFSGMTFAASSIKVEIPGFSISPLSGPGGVEGGEEWWMASTKPAEMSRYALTNKTVTQPITVTILLYASAEQAKKAFEMSWKGRPAAPKTLNSPYWDAAHEWQTSLQGVDIFLLKGNYAVGVYDLPSKKSDELLHALADNIVKAEQGGAVNGSQPNRSETNSTRIGGTDSLTVLAKASKANVRVGETFNVSLRVENTAPTNQYVLVWGCSWSENWKADNTNIVLFGQECTKNTVGPVEIKPGCAYINEGEMQVLHPVPGNRLSFRMGFTPFTGLNASSTGYVWGKTLWSDEVVIGVIR